MTIEDFQYLLAFLPPKAQAIVLGVLCLLGSLSLLALAINKAIITAIGVPQPNDPEWKVKLYKRVAWIDGLGLSPTTIRSWLEIARKEKVIRSLLIPAPPPEPPQRDTLVGYDDETGRHL